MSPESIRSRARGFAVPGPLTAALCVALAACSHDVEVLQADGSARPPDRTDADDAALDTDDAALDTDAAEVRDAAPDADDARDAAPDADDARDAALDADDARDVAPDMPADLPTDDSAPRDAVPDAPRDAAPPDAPVADAGVCAEASLRRCGEQCADITSDPANCGACGTRCASACASGRCLVVAELGAGEFHACARMTDGSLYCWGENIGGLLGDGTERSRVVPAAVIGIGPAAQLDVCIRHTCARMMDGTVTCWSQYGDPPAAVPGLTGVLEVVGRSEHNCALLSDHTVRCWGDNTYGQLGDNTTTNRDTPAPVLNAAGTAPLSDVLHVASGGYHTCALLMDHTVRCWGTNGRGQLGDGTSAAMRALPVTPAITGVAELAPGFEHTCALMMDGSARCWGANDNSALGDGTSTDRHAPVTVLGSGAPTLTAVAHLSAGGYHTCALITDGTVRCWGGNLHGQLGTTAATAMRPVPVPSLAGVAQLAAGHDFTCALLTDGTVRCWGYDADGQLGDASSAQRTPAPVTGLSGVAQVVAGEGHTCAVLTTGALRCWGGGQHGQLGDRGSDDRSTPVVAVGLTGVAEVSTGYEHTCARLVDRGTVQCWGYDAYGQLGSGATVRPDLTIPAPVLDASGAAGSALAGVAQLPAGQGHHCARMTGATVQCWGDNEYGELGIDPMTLLSTVPRVLPGLSGVTDLAVSQFHGCAVVAGGAVQCWGISHRGSLGDGSGANHFMPVLVADLTTATQVSLGSDSSCARLTDGTARCWGNDDDGQLGDGLTVGTGLSATTPVAVTDGMRPLGNVAEVSVGAYHACARMTDGTARCWGLNDFGQLGDGTVATRSLSAPVPGLVGVAALSSGGYHTCARLTDGSVRCWGRNTAGQVGNGVALLRNAPAAVLWR